MKNKGMRSLTILIAVVVSAVAVVSTTGTRRVSAATLTVNNLNDSGPGSLRQAVFNASPGDTIVFSVMGTIVLTTGEIQDKDLTISGSGAQSLTISGNNTSRVLNVLQGAVRLAGLTISKGSGQGADLTNAIGGGISNSGILTVDHCTILDCFCFAPIGDFGGGMYNASSLIVTNSTISRNNAEFCGGIFNDASASLVVNNSTISGNFAGGIFNSDRATLTVTSSTISGNRFPGGGGGGITDFGSSGIKDSTICGNSAHDCGGFLALTPTPRVILNTIIALNTASVGSPDVNGNFNSLATI